MVAVIGAVDVGADETEVVSTVVVVVSVVKVKPVVTVVLDVDAVVI